MDNASANYFWWTTPQKKVRRCPSKILVDNATDSNEPSARRWTLNTLLGTSMLWLGTHKDNFGGMKLKTFPRPLPSRTYPEVVIFKIVDRHGFEIFLK